MEVNLPQRAFYIFLVAVGVLGYPDGAPDKACVSMTPGHYATFPQTTESPYSLSVSSAGIYYSNETITVTINGTFQGVLLQARRYDGSSTEPVGTFVSVSSNTKTKTCSNTDDSVTHSDTQEKSSFSASWRAPSEATGIIQFRATVAEVKSVYWVGITSIRLEHVFSTDTDCYYDGKWYTSGTSFGATDGCNTCFCEMGNVGCTEMWCENPDCPSMDCVIDPECGFMMNTTRDGCPACPICWSQASRFNVGFIMTLFSLIITCINI